MERLHYLPSVSARSLRNAPTMLIGVVVPDLANPTFVTFLRGVEHVAQAHGYAVLVVDAQRSSEVERLALDRLLAQRVDALVLAGPTRNAERIEELRSSGAVVLDASPTGGFPGSLVPELEQPGTVAMCESLAALGHRRIGYVSRWETPGEAGQRRWQLIKSRCQQLGVRAERTTLRGLREPEEVAQLLDGQIRGAEPLTALVCATHGLAPLILHALRTADLELPGDCSFVTYGDSEWAAAYRPPISVVTMDLHAVASYVTQLVIDELHAPDTAPGTMPPPSQFLGRESTGIPPQE